MLRAFETANQNARVQIVQARTLSLNVDVAEERLVLGFRNIHPKGSTQVVN